MFISASTGILISLVPLQVYSSQGGLWFDNKHQTWTTQQIQHLKSLLEDSSIVKVLHDAGAVAAALVQWEGLAICNVFDIQVTPPPSPENVCVQLFCVQTLPAMSFSSLCRSMTCLVCFIFVVCSCVLSHRQYNPDKIAAGVNFFMLCRLLRVSWSICKACWAAPIVNSVTALRTLFPCMNGIYNSWQVLLLLVNILLCCVQAKIIHCFHHAL